MGHQRELDAMRSHSPDSPDVDKLLEFVSIIVLGGITGSHHNHSSRYTAALTAARGRASTPRPV